jgi:hypothetical protein
MKNALYLFFFIFSSLCLTAQQKDRFSLTAAVGYSVPVGRFANGDGNQVFFFSDNNIAGWAKPGPAVKFDLNYALTKSAGIMLSATGQINPRSRSAFLKDMSHTFADNSNLVVSAGSWKIGRVMAGGYYDLYFSTAKSWRCRISLLAGVLKTSLPSYATIDSSGNPADLEHNPPSPFPWVFCYQFGAALQRNIGHAWYISFQLDFFGADVKGNIPTPAFFYPYQLDTDRVYITSLTGMLGLGFRF